MRRLSLWVLLLTAWPGFAHAQQLLSVSAQMLGNQREDAAYIYVRVDVENRSGREVEYDVDLTGGYALAWHVTDQKVPPAGVRHHHLALPARQSYTIRALVTDDTGRRLSANAGDYHIRRSILHIAELGAWVSEADKVKFSEAIGHKGHAYPGSSTGKSHVVSEIEPDLVPDAWLCYAPFLAVVVPQNVYRRLEGERRRALLDYVAMGGLLLIYDASEPRTEEVLQGKIVFQKDNPLLQAEQAQGTRLRPPDWMRFSGSGSGQIQSRFPFRVTERGGRLGSMLLATIFLIVAGPVNYLYWRRRDRIRMVVLTLPMISMLFCALIFAYFLVTAGFQRRGGTLSVTLLDEARNTGITWARHVYYSGLRPLGGFHFDRATAFTPLEWKRGAQFDVSDGLTLESGLFSPSFNFHYFTARPFQTRERLVVDTVEDTVTNGFEVDLERLVLLKGGFLYVLDDLRSGEHRELPKTGRPTGNMDRLTALLGEVIEPEEREYIERYMQWTLGQGERAVYLASFRARIDSAEPGVSMPSAPFRGVLIGVGASGAEVSGDGAMAWAGEEE